MKKLIALAIALIMVLALVPMTMAAQLPGGDIVVGAGQDLTYDLVGEVTGSIEIKDGGKLTINGTGTFNGGINIYNGELTLNGGTYLDTIYVRGAAKIYVGATAKVLAQVGNAGIYVHDCDGEVGDEIDPEITIDVYGTLAGQWDGLQTNGQLQDLSTNRVVNIYPGAKLYPLANAGRGTAAIYAAGYMIWNISGGSFRGETCLSIKCGVWNISGGEFLANGKHSVPATANSNGSEDTGAALSITSNGDYAPSMNFNITGGTFVSEQGNALYEGIAVKDGQPLPNDSFVQQLKIEDGIFYSEKEAVEILKAEADVIDVTGGTYSDNSVLAIAPEADITVSTEKPTLSTSNSTLVKIKSEVAYTVIIPAIIDFGTMKKSEATKTMPFVVQLSDAFLGEDACIDVKVASATDFMFTDTFGYVLTAGGNQPSGLYCRLTMGANNDINNGSVSCNPANMPYAGTFTDTMVFSIDYVANMPDPTVGT